MCAVAWVLGAAGLAAIAGLAAVAVGATVAGVDSRSSGDWTVTPRV
jgi:hypothetical protein